MRHRVIAVFGLYAASLLLAGNASAQLYQWRDTNGRVVYSDAPPPPNIPPGSIIKTPKGRSTAVPTPAPTTAAAVDSGKPGATASAGAGASTGAGASSTSAKAGGPKTVAEREAEYKKRQAESAEKAQKDEQTAAADQRREEQCKGMRQGMAALESGQRVRRFNDKGEPYFVDDAERGRELEKMRKDMATAKCG